ncbi:hypothetical protein, partial [Ralstonia syzygii]
LRILGLAGQVARRIKTLGGDVTQRIDCADLLAAPVVDQCYVFSPIMCVALQGGTSMTDHDDQLRNSAAVPADQSHDELRSSTTEWRRRAMDGIKQMHENEDVRREVAKRIF